MIGTDTLGMASKHWNMKAMIKGWRKGVAFGLFADETFGPFALSNAQKMADTGLAPAVRAHLNWEGPNPKHQLPPLSKIKALAPRWQQFAVRNPGMKVYVSPTCEYDSQNKGAIKQMLDLTAQLCPSCTIVQTPTSKGATVPGYMIERHGKVVVGAGQIVSYDGGKMQPDGQTQGLFDIDAAKWINLNSQAEITFAWAPLCNMAEAHNTAPPNQRDDAPSADYITSLIRLFDSPGIAPTPVFNFTPLKKPELYKSHAEDSPGSDPRNNRPLVIVGPQTSFIELVTFQGKTVCKLPYAPNVGPFPGGLHRYYSGNPGGPILYGWQIADKAIQMSGYPHVWIKQNHKFKGPINPIFRTPFFQA